MRHDTLPGEAPALNVLTVDEWAARITARWQDSVEAILDVGRMLIQAQAEVGHGNWLRLIEKLPFGESTAQKLQRIVDPEKAPHLSNPEHVPDLPPSWGTLHVLSRLTPERFEAGVAAGVIRPDMERKEAEALLGGNGQNALRAFSGNNEYYTPALYIEAAREVMGEIDLDPASCALAQETVRAERYFTEEDDGLTKRWDGRLWMNPPYAAGLIDKFARKLVAEVESGHVTAGIVLADNRTDAGWFYTMAVACERICFTRGRINFYNASTASSSPANGSAFFYFGDDPDTFEEVFAQFGWVVPSPSAARRARASTSSATQTDKFGGEAA
jgi:hypothetical protein